MVVVVVEELALESAELGGLGGGDGGILLLRGLAGSAVHVF